MLKLYKFKEFLSEKYFTTDVGTRFLPSYGGENQVKKAAVNLFKNKIDGLHDRLIKHYHSENKEGNEAIKNYSGKLGYQINDYLHTKVSQVAMLNHRKTINTLSSHLKSKKAPETFHVYTGLKEDPRLGHRGVKNVTEGSDHFKARLPAFTSTSLHPAVSNEFALENLNSKKDYNMHLLKIEIPKGSKHGLYIAGQSNHPGEKEFLMDKDKKIHISKEPQIIHSKSGEYTYHTHIWHAKIV